MSAAAAAAATPPEAAPKKKGKTLLFVLIGVVVLDIAAAGAALLLLKKNTAEDEDFDDEHAPAATKRVDPKSAPTFLPLDTMVVNLADAGGNRYIQVGLTLQLQDSATGDAVKAFMPSIRSRILVLLSKRTAEEVLSAEGKERLSADIIEAVGETMGYSAPKPAEGEGKRRRANAPASPVQAVLFSSFIVQ